MEVVSRAADPDCDPALLAELVGRDAVLCAWVLRAVNSAAFGFRRKVTSVPAAVRHLGVRPLRSLALAFALTSLRWAPLPREVLEAYWRASLAGALAARQLATRRRRPDPDTDLAAGLIRDVGVLLLHQLFPVEYRPVLDTSAEFLSAFQCELEEGALGLDHAEAGAELLRAWSLPEELTEPVRCHHDWVRAERLPAGLRERATDLCLASQVADLYVTPNRPMLFRQVARRAGELHGLSGRELELFLQSIRAQISDLAGALNVSVGDPDRISRVLGRGIEELARLALSGSDPSAASDATSAGGRAAPAQDDSLVRVTGGPRGGGWVDFAPSEPALDLLTARLFPAAGPGKLGKLDGYEVTRLIGHGAMGAVFEAVDLRLERPVAIKVLLPHLAEEPAARSRFLREGRAIAAVAHDNVVGVHGVGEAGGVPYIVMEYVAGRGVEAWLLEAPLPLPDVLRIGLDVASGLAAAHTRGLVHRDVKPANLLFDRAANRVKIVDFGLAQVGAKDPHERGGELVGTPYYMSPEQAEGRGVDSRSDLFSLGAVLYLACTGIRPFEAATVAGVLRAVREHAPPPLRSLNPAVPAWLEEVVAGLLNKDPACRFPRAEEMKRLFLIQRARHVAERTSGVVRRPPGRLPPDKGK
jgi:HD-like signal output (HDOD) protein